MAEGRSGHEQTTLAFGGESKQLEFNFGEKKAPIRLTEKGQSATSTEETIQMLLRGEVDGDKLGQEDQKLVIKALEIQLGQTQAAGQPVPEDRKSIFIDLWSNTVFAGYRSFRNELLSLTRDPNTQRSELTSALLGFRQILFLISKLISEYGLDKSRSPCKDFFEFKNKFNKDFFVKSSETNIEYSDLYKYFEKLNGIILDIEKGKIWQRKATALRQRRIAARGELAAVA
ncbi:MAG: hypothetical protein V2A63_03305 [Patescibacteria group bacterium]